MRAVVQRVTQADVTVEENVTGAIRQGLVVLLGVEDGDTEKDADYTAEKVAGLRIFDDADGVMNRSVQDVGGDIIVVSQFTLHASTVKGNRPSYLRAAHRQTAIPLYEAFLQKIGEDLGHPVGAGVFGADMKVDLLNDGPVTILIDTKVRE